MTRATTRQKPAGHKPVTVRDSDGEIACLSCGHLFAWGTASRSIGSLSLSRLSTHDIVAVVPEPVAELDDDDFARTRGFGS